MSEREKTPGRLPDRVGEVYWGGTSLISKRVTFHEKYVLLSGKNIPGVVEYNVKIDTPNFVLMSISGNSKRGGDDFLCGPLAKAWLIWQS